MYFVFQMVIEIPTYFTRLEVLLGSITAQCKIACKFCHIFFLLLSIEVRFESSNGNTEQSLLFKAGDWEYINPAREAE